MSLIAWELQTTDLPGVPLERGRIAADHFDVTECSVVWSPVADWEWNTVTLELRAGQGPTDPVLHRCEVSVSGKVKPLRS